MKIIILAFLCLTAMNAPGQDIVIQYKDAAGLQMRETVVKGTQTIDLNAATPFTSFSLIISNLPVNHKVHVLTRNGQALQAGTVIAGNGTTAFTATSNLANESIQFVVEDASNVKTVYAVVLLQILPAATLSIPPAVPTLAAAVSNPCSGCTYEGSAVIYDYSKNSIGYTKPSKWFVKRPLVGSSMTFTVKNINPFRDSVIIGSETLDYNTDVPDLFTKAFFSPLMAGGAANKLSILADVLELEKQLDMIIRNLQDMECQDICTIVQAVSIEIEKQFDQAYGYKATKKDLIAFLIQQLPGLDPVHREAVVRTLNKYRAFRNTRNYYNYNIPQVQNVDAYLFTLSIIPKTGEKSQTIVDRQPILVSTVGGFKVDFSTGLFVTSLYDHRFSLRPDSSVIRNSYGGDSIVFNRRNQIVQQSNDQKLDFGVSALAHFYPRLTPNVNVALTLGAGLSIDKDPSIRYLAGGSFLFGRKGRLGITYGVAAGFVDRLEDNLQNLQYTSISDKKAIVKKTFKTGNFLSMTFNIPLFKPKVKEASPPKEEEKPKEETKTEEKKEGEKK